LAYPCEVSNCDFVSFWSKSSSAQGDKLQFIIDGSTIEEWSGLTEWSFHSYKVEPGMHQLEWRYTKNSETVAGSDAAWIDNIHLPVHKQVIANVPETGSVCAASPFETSATAENYFTINWQTQGDGTFNDINLANAVYTPGVQDIQNKKAILQMHLQGYVGCLDSDKSIDLDINSLPVINLPSDTIVSIGENTLLDATIDSDVTYNWQPFGISAPSIIIDSTSSVNGTKSANLTITSSKGCSTTKEIKVHFNNSAIDDAYSIYPNPSNGNFTLKPVKGSALINQMRLVDRQGKVVWNNEENMNIVGSKQISIAGLMGGTYLLVTENNNGRSTNPVVIQ
jgi:hypothetical protein